jgi:hypothetical protein
MAKHKHPTSNTCQVKRCRRPAVMDYYGFGVCDLHWSLDCDEKKRFNLKQQFNIQETHHEPLENHL